MGEDDALTKDQRTVCVSQLTQKTREKHLRRYFRQYGRVRNVVLLRDHYGRHRGFAYVEMSTLEAVQQVLVLSGQVPNWQRFPILISGSQAEKNVLGFGKSEKAADLLSHQQQVVQQLLQQTTASAAAAEACLLYTSPSPRD